VLGTGSTFSFTIPVKELRSEEPGVPITPLLLRVSTNEELGEKEKVAFQNEGFDYQIETAPQDALETARQSQPNVILIDPTIADGVGWKILLDLKNDPQTCGIPVNTFSLSRDYEKGFNLGVGDFATKPVDNMKLEKAASHLLPIEHGNLLALVIDDSDEELENCAQILGTFFEGEIQTATSGFEGLVAARQHSPDLVVLDLFMPNADGFRMLEALRVDERTRLTPIILVLPAELDEVLIRQLTLWTSHSQRSANLSIETYAESLREKLFPRVGHTPGGGVK
jgi:CheY-like chemotaxis protein